MGRDHVFRRARPVLEPIPPHAAARRVYVASNSQGLHESEEALDPATRDRHRAIASIIEELEAVDWYDQRVAATNDPALARVLAHNRDEEKEHAAMTLEWLRRNDAQLDAHLRTYLFTRAEITEIEEAVETSSAAEPSPA
jgi:ferritin-like protein